MQLCLEKGGNAMKKVLHGDIIYASKQAELRCVKNGYLVYESGIVKGVYEKLPQEDQTAIFEDYKNCLIIPGFNDIHLHAPQWKNCGIGYSMELLPWLNTYTFPLEKRFEEEAFAKTYYKRFLQDMLRAGTTRASIFATRHEAATRILIEEIRKSGMGAYVGKVNMDRNAIDGLQEKTKDSLLETERLINWVEETRENDLVNYIMTPRFVPSTTTELMKGLGALTEKYQLKVQSHLSENKSEIEWVHSLHPECRDFASVYYDYGLMPKDRTVMAHCIHNTIEEQELLKQQGVLMAHCAASNMNLSSGIMPLRSYLENGQKVGIASDISGGDSVDMRKNIVSTIQASKLYWCSYKECAPISFTEAFYLATRGSGQLFGKVGAFEEGFEMDALVIADQTNQESSQTQEKLSLEERLEKYIYTGNVNEITLRLVHGNEIRLTD